MELKIKLGFLCLGLIFMIDGCASSEKKSENNSNNVNNSSDDSSNNEGKGKRKRKKRKKREKNDESDDDYGQLVNFTYSLSNDKESDLDVNRGKVGGIADRLSSAKSPKQLATAMSANRLSGKNLSSVIEAAKKLAEIELSKDIKNELPEYAKLELALAALQAKKYSLAEFYIDQIKESKDSAIAAAAINAEGIILFLDGNIPEAEISWKKALSKNSKYEAALLNLGFVSLSHADFKKAIQMFESNSDVKDNYFVKAALISAYRLESESPEKVSKMCEDVVSKRPKSKSVLYNCGLHEFQGSKDLSAAKKYFERVTKIPTISTEVDELAYAQLSKVDGAELQEKQKSKAK